MSMSVGGAPVGAQSARDLSNRNFFWGWFVAVNLALLVSALWIGPIGFYLPAIGIVGSFLSLFFAKWLAIRAHRIKLIKPQFFKSGAEQEIYELVSELAHKAGLEVTPEVGVYRSDDMNAFATGAGRRSSLIAFSSALLEDMPKDQIRAVAAHEVAHIANQDMLAMVLLQGVINAVILTVTAPLAAFALMFRASDDENAGTYEWVCWIAKILVAAVLAFIGSLIVKGYSRRREFRADALAARLVGKESMIVALTTIAKNDAAIPREQLSYAALKISGGRSIFGEWLSTHPAMERRIEALQNEALERT